MSTSPQPINALKTRVVKTKEGQFMPQCSTDGMIWFDFSRAGFPDYGIACGRSKFIEECASRTPSAGEIVWKSY
jgi:hypothetical protein